MKAYKKIIISLLSLALLIPCGIMSAMADQTTGVEINFDSIADCVTSGLHTGDTLRLPNPRATRDGVDCSSEVKAKVINTSSEVINQDGSLVIANMQAGMYQIQYMVGTEVFSKKYYVTVSDVYPSLTFDAPNSQANLGSNLRVKKVDVGETGYTVGISLVNRKGVVEGDAPDQSTVATKQIIFTPQTSGISNIIYTVKNETKTVRYAYPITIVVDDYKGNFLGLTFEEDIYVYNCGASVWANIKESDRDLAFRADITEEESRSGKQSLKFTSVNPQYQPTLFFGWNLNDKQMMKDDVTKYVVEFYMKAGDDIVCDSIPKIDCHMVARENWNASSHYGIYRWDLGNCLTKVIGQDGWVKVSYEIVAVSDETCFALDNIGMCSTANYSSYGGIQLVFLAKNYSGTIYIDDISVYKKGVTVDDLLTVCPHDSGESSGDSKQEEKKEEGSTQEKSGCGSVMNASLITLFGALVLVVKNRKVR